MLRLLKNNDPEAFRTFYFQWDKRLYAYFLKRVKNENHAEELTQLTFIKMWKYRGSLSEEHSLETQLFRKAQLIYIDWLRKEAVRRKRESLESTYCIETAIEDLDKATNTQVDRLRNELDQLPPLRRKIIELSHIDGFSYKEIAQKLNISVKTVDNHVTQALKQLRKLLTLFFY